MKKIILLSTLCAIAIAATAQNDIQTATLKHGDQITVFQSAQAFALAHQAAVDGDIITLSEGNFNATDIQKSITVYGAGFEEKSENATRITQFNGSFSVALPTSTDTLKNVHIEGVKINGDLRFGLRGGPTALCAVKRCHVTGAIYFDQPSENPIIEQCVVTYNISGNGQILKNLLVANCFVGGVVTNFNETASTVLVNHSIICSYYDNRSGNNNINFKNTIFAQTYPWSYSVAAPKYSILTNCIVASERYSEGTVTNNVHVVPLADIFADADNATYAPERTFATKQPETWVGTDESPIGITGGLTWIKAPAIPSVKNLILNVEGNQLKVNYETEVR